MTHTDALRHGATRSRFAGLVCLLATVLATACATVPPVATPEPPTWSALAGESTVVVVTRDPDGDERVTTIWIAVDGESNAFIRTKSSRWFANLQRDPALRLRAAGREYTVKTELVTDAAQVAKIDQLFKTKYGFQDSLIRFVRGGIENRIRLVASR